MQSAMNLLERFESGTLNPAEFHHRQHVEVVWLYLKQYTVTEVLVRFPEALKSFARSIGKENLYHATVTWAFILLVHERMERTRIAGHEISTFDQFAAANPDLLSWKPSILSRYYGQKTLESDVARAVFLFPDRVSS